MILTHDALFGLVKATRLAMRLEEDTEKLLVDKRCETVAGALAGTLKDVLFEMSGEKLTAEQDFENDSAVVRILKSSISDERATNIFETLGNGNRPKLLSREEFIEMLHENGGYMYLPPKM